LGEVVVTGALGIKTEARQLGYATATVDNKLLTEDKVTAPATGLNGKVPGLQTDMVTNGAPGSASNVYVRGFGDFKARIQYM
jgi:hypothetical protein